MCEIIILTAIGAALLFPYVSAVMLTKGLWKELCQAEAPADETRKG